MNIFLKKTSREMRHKRVRSKVKGTAQRPRLSLFRSNKHIFLQLIDDGAGRTLLSASDYISSIEKKKAEKKSKSMSESGDRRIDEAEKLGKRMAKDAAGKNITAVVFDRGGYKFHGLVKAVAKGARSGGLNF